MEVLYQKDWKVAKIWKTSLLFYGCHGNGDDVWYQVICNKILGKVTKFGEKRTKTLGVANRFMVGGHNVPPLGYRVKRKFCSPLVVIIQFEKHEANLIGPAWGLFNNHACLRFLPRNAMNKG